MARCVRGRSKRPSSTRGWPRALAYPQPMTAGEWTFLSNHGHVLVSLARNPDGRMRDVAEAVGITERAVQHIVRDLVEQGYLDKEKVGRRNRYDVVRAAHLRHQLESHVTLGSFLDLLLRDSADPAPTSKW